MRTELNESHIAPQGEPHTNEITLSQPNTQHQSLNWRAFVVVCRWKKSVTMIPSTCWVMEGRNREKQTPPGGLYWTHGGNSFILIRTNCAQEVRGEKVNPPRNWLFSHLTILNGLGMPLSANRYILCRINKIKYCGFGVSGTYSVTLARLTVALYLQCLC